MENEFDSITRGRPFTAASEQSPTLIACGGPCITDSTETTETTETPYAISSAKYGSIQSSLQQPKRADSSRTVPDPGDLADD